MAASSVARHAQEAVRHRAPEAGSASRHVEGAPAAGVSRQDVERTWRQDSEDSSGWSAQDAGCRSAVGGSARTEAGVPPVVVHTSCLVSQGMGPMRRGPCTTSRSYMVRASPLVRRALWGLVPLVPPNLKLYIGGTPSLPHARMWPYKNVGIWWYRWYICCNRALTRYDVVPRRDRQVVQLLVGPSSRRPVVPSQKAFLGSCTAVPPLLVHLGSREQLRQVCRLNRSTHEQEIEERIRSSSLTVLAHVLVCAIVFPRWLSQSAVVTCTLSLWNAKLRSRRA